MRVDVKLGDSTVATLDVEVTEDLAEQEADQYVGDDDSSLRAAAAVWNSLSSNAVFVINGKTYTAAECAEWWA